MSIIGIDLGTTNSLASYWRDGRLQLIPQGNDRWMLPSVVGLDEDGGILVGDPAKARRVTHCRDTFASFKCFMGTEKEYRMGGKTYTPVDFSAMVLAKIKGSAEAFLGEPVEEAVISVPAYFNDRQRSDTKKAARIAGLPVRRLINEPSAAALAYRMERNSTSRNLLVFDFGGGTLDLSLVECFDNIVEIVAIAGDNHLGGDDIDRLIAQYWCRENGLDYSTLSDGEQNILVKQAEKLKIALSDRPDETVTARIRMECASIDVSLTESGLFEICLPLFQKIRPLFLKILKDSDYHVSEIDDLVMVGGSSKVPVVKQFLREMLGREPVLFDKPDYAVAYGMGAYAGIRERSLDIKDIVLTDVCPFTLGTGTYWGKNDERAHMYPMIERNSTLPASHRETFFTHSDFQTEVCVKIYQGEEYELEDNVCLGSLSIDVEPKRAGEEAVVVDFTYDLNGILQVQVTNDAGEVKQLVIANHEMDEEELKLRMEALQMIRMYPAMQEDNLLLIERAQSLYEQMLGDGRKYIVNLIQWFYGCLASGRRTAIARAAAYMNQQLESMEAQMEHADTVYFDGNLKLPHLDPET